MGHTIKTFYSQKDEYVIRLTSNTQNDGNKVSENILNHAAYNERRLVPSTRHSKKTVICSIYYL